MNKDYFQIDIEKILEEKVPKLNKRIPHFVLNKLKKIIHVDELNDILRINKDNYGVDFMNSVVNYFHLDIQTYGLDDISNDNRYIFVSNHPLGGLDGICLSSVIGNKYNHNIKYIVNDLLYYLENLKPIFIPINKHGAQSKKTSEITQEAFSSNSQIITFPSGMCSRKIDGKIQDPIWKKSFIQKAIEYKRDIVPVFFEAVNSNFFYRFANLRKSLGIQFNIEMLFLPDEMFKNKGRMFKVYFGKPIPYTLLDKSKTQNDWAKYVREIVYNLKESRK